MVKQHFVSFVLVMVALMGFGGSVAAQETEVIQNQIEKRYTIYFKLNQTAVDLNYRDNNVTIDEMVKELDSILKSEGTVPHNLHIIASASPEGPVALNRRLASQRAEKVKVLLIKLIPQYKNEKIEVEYVINDWDGVILDIKRHKESIKHSEQILKVLENPKYTNKQKDSIIRRMPAAFEEIRYSLMDNQRTASITFTIKEYKKVEPQPEPAPEPPVQQDTVAKVVEVAPEPAPEPQPIPIIYKTPTEKRWSPVLRIKTNTLGWAMGHANIAAEINIGKHWSFAVPFYFSGGFNYFKETIKFRGIVLQPEIRYYKSNNNKGFYLGAHYGLGWYNYALDGEFRIQDHRGERPSQGGGLAAGYNWQFKKHPRWGMELSLGAGIYDSKYDKFYNEENGPYAETAIRKTWIGIDNASVSFTYSFDFKKGGRK